MTTAEILINQSVLETRTVRTTDQSVIEDLNVACDDDCDAAPVQVGLTSRDEPIMGVRYWGTTEDGSEWAVTVETVES